MQPDGVIVFNVLFYYPASVVKGKRDTRTDTFSFDGLVESFQLAVLLRIEWRRPYMGHSRDPDKFFEIFGNELRAVVGNNPWSSGWVLFLGPFKEDFNVSFSHLLSDFPMDNGADTSIQETTQVVEGPTDVKVRDVNMPVVMRQQRLNKPCPIELAGA